MLFWLERHDEAYELLSGLIHAARREQRAGRAASCRCAASAEIEVRRGRWAVARAELEEAVDLEAEVAESVFAAYAHQTLARLAAATATKAAATTMPRPPTPSPSATATGSGGSTCSRRWACSSSASAVPRRRSNTSVPPPSWRRCEASASRTSCTGSQISSRRTSRVRRLGEARVALERFAEQAARTGGAWALGAAARCRGLLAPATDADAHFADALGPSGAAQRAVRPRPHAALPRRTAAPRRVGDGSRGRPCRPRPSCSRRSAPNRGPREPARS